MTAKWDQPGVKWDETPAELWGGTLQGTLWVNDNGTWRNADEVHPWAKDGTWQDPVLMWGFKNSVQYMCWPRQLEPVFYPPVENLRVTSKTSTSITVAWDALALTPIRYRISWDGPGLIEAGGADNGLTLTATKSGLTIDSTYTITVWADYSDGSSEMSTLVASTSAATAPSITSWTPRTYNILDLVIAGTPPFTLRCSSGARAGNTYAWSAAGAQAIGGCVGKEYWYIDNAGGSTARFWTDDGTAAVSGTTGAIKNTLANPLPTGGRGSCVSVAWGDAGAFSTHASYPIGNTNDGTGATRWQTGNYPQGWMQHGILLPAVAGYRARRFFFVQGDGAGNTECVTPVYSIDGGATWKRYTKAFGTWVSATDATVHPGKSSPNGLLSISSDGNWDRDWNWRLTSAAQFATPYITENAQDLPASRVIYLRWGIVHLTGSFGANMGECWLEYQEPSTPAKAEVKCTRGWG